jgi:phospholipid/cholesterol/gamma-HCH transport system ATP-binding protein
MIKIQNVYKSFGKQVVLAGLNLDIPLNKTMAIVGPSGVGKSVLLKLIFGLLKPDSGDIYVFDKNIAKISSEKKKNEIRTDLGVLFQSAALLDYLNVFDNIAFPLKERRQLARREIEARVYPIMESLSLVSYAFKMPDELTIGIRKRVGLARALITEPKIILFDEPNTGLDPLVGQEVYDLILQCQKEWKFTGIVISHEIPEVFQIVDEVAMLLKGKIIAVDTATNIIQCGDEAVQQFLNGRKDGPIKIC